MKASASRSKKKKTPRKVIYSFGADGLLRTARSRQPVLHQHLDAHPDRRCRLGARASPRAPPRRSRCYRRARRSTPRLARSAPPKRRSPSPGRCRPNRTSCATVPVGTREFSKTQEGSCKGECSVRNFTGLKPEPYEVILKSPEGREGREKTQERSSPPRCRRNPGRRTSPRPPSPGARRRKPAKLRLGQTLTASPGSWSGSPTQFLYQWLRCEGNGEAGSSEELGSECEPITTSKGPATGETYEVQPQDVSRTIAVKVEAKNASGSRPWRSPDRS